MTSKEAARGESGKIARAFGVISAATTASRVMGLVRDSLTAALFGAGGVMDAFFVAYRLPNIFRALLAEGSLTTSFVPVYSEVLEKEGEEAANRLGRVAFTALFIFLCLFVVLGIFFAPELITFMGMGFGTDAEKMGLTVTLAKWLFPFIGLVSLTALAGGILNARGVFLYPALAPVTLNVVIIAVTLLLYAKTEPPVMALAFGVLAGGAAQFALQLGPLKRAGFSFSPSLAFGCAHLKRVIMLAGPSIFGVAVYQLNILVSTMMATWLGEGAVSYLYYAERLFQLPLGVFAVSVGVASLPSLGRLSARGETEAFHLTLSHSVRMIVFIVLPSSVGLWVLSEPIVALLFERGRFSAEMTVGTAEVLRFYALSMVPVAVSRVLAQGFYALKEMKTPVAGAALSFLVNIALGWHFAFALGMGAGGLALATAFSSAANMLYLIFGYASKTGRNPLSGLGLPFLFMALCAAAMGGAVYLALAATAAALGGGGTLFRAAQVGLFVPLGALAYWLVSRLAGLRDMDELIARMRGRG